MEGERGWKEKGVGIGGIGGYVCRLIPVHAPVLSLSLALVYLSFSSGNSTSGLRLRARARAVFLDGARAVGKRVRAVMPGPGPSPFALMGPLEGEAGGCTPCGLGLRALKSSFSGGGAGPCPLSTRGRPTLVPSPSSLLSPSPPDIPGGLGSSPSPPPPPPPPPPSPPRLSLGKSDRPEAPEERALRGGWEEVRGASTVDLSPSFATTPCSSPLPPPRSFSPAPAIPALPLPLPLVLLLLPLPRGAAVVVVLVRGGGVGAAGGTSSSSKHQQA